MKSVFYFVAVLAIGAANQINIVNNCPFTIWPGLQGNPGHANPEDGGFVLPAYQSKIINVGNKWGGRIWARTSCDESGRCQTGDCGGKIQCNGAGGTPPVSLAEVTLSGWGDLDYYDISLVDGYNLPVKMVPTRGFQIRDGSKYDCNPAGCHTDLNAICPAELAVKSGEWTVACNSACMKFDTDEYCCRGAFGLPTTCKSEHWPVNYPAIYKQACPDAYSYAYDDTSSTFTCKGAPATNYDVVFCP